MMILPLMVATIYLICLQVIGAVQVLQSRVSGEMTYFAHNQQFMYRNLNQLHPDFEALDQDSLIQSTSSTGLPLKRIWMWC